MSQPNASNQERAKPKNMKEARLPRRDWFLLPMLSLLTMGLVLLITESVARRMFPASGNIGHDCVLVNPSTGVRGIPNCVGTEQNLDGPIVEYKFNNCGHRAGMDCDPKLRGVYRIVMTGTSLSMGYGVSSAQGIAALLPTKLSRQTGHNIEIYNESLVLGSPYATSLTFNDLLAAKPDLILWVLSPYDTKSESGPSHRQKLDIADGTVSSGINSPPGVLTRARKRIYEAMAKGSLSNLALDVWNEHPSSILTRHFLYALQSLYVKAFLMGGDSEAGFLRVDWSPEWQEYLREFDTDAASIEGQAKAAGVPIAVVLVPNRAQAAMISMGQWPSGYDPYKIGEELRTIITAHGGIYIDILPEFRNLPNPEQYYYPVDGHPNARGHAIIAEFMARQLTGGAVPALKAVSQQQVALERGR